MVKNELSVKVRKVSILYQTVWYNLSNCFPFSDVELYVSFHEFEKKNGLMVLKRITDTKVNEILSLFERLLQRKKIGNVRFIPWVPGHPWPCCVSSMIIDESW